MKAEQFACGLRALAALNTTETASSLISLSDLLHSQGDVSIADVSKKAKKLPSAPHGLSAEITVGHICDVLDILMNMLHEFSVTAAGEDTKRVIGFLRPHDQEVFSGYIGRLSDVLSIVTEHPIVSANETVVKYYLDQLEKLNYEPNRFSELLKKLSSDKKVRVKGELTKIANQFYEVDFKYKTKKEALDVIRRRHSQDNRVRNEDRAFAKQR